MMTATNGDLARYGAHAFDILGHYDHLPPLECVAVNQRGSVLVSIGGRSNEDRLRNMAGWAKAFTVPVSLDTEACRVKIKLLAYEVLFRFDETVDRGFGLLLCAAMVGRPVPQVAVTADQLLAGLDRVAAAEERAAS